jgi:hypothetical protein
MFLTRYGPFALHSIVGGWLIVDSFAVAEINRLTQSACKLGPGPFNFDFGKMGSV